MRHVVPIALLTAFAQALTEGPRWQMVPAYALTALFFLYWLVQNSMQAGPPDDEQAGYSSSACALGSASSPWRPPSFRR